MLRQHWLEAYRCGLREFVLRPKGLPFRRRFIDSYNLLSWLRLDKLLILCFPEFSVCWVSLHMIQFVTSIGQYGYYMNSNEFLNCICTSCCLVIVIWYGILFLFWFFRQHFGCNHPKYADTLIDYGYYLLNVDAINRSVKVYRVSISKNL